MGNEEKYCLEKIEKLGNHDIGTAYFRCVYKMNIETNVNEARTITFITDSINDIKDFATKEELELI